VPYYIYYSTHQYIIGKQAKYLTTLIVKIKELRSRLVSFRHLLKHLLQKKVITHTLYRKTDKVIIKKMLRIERAIQQRRITISSVKNQLEVIYNILRRLDYNTKIPVDCATIARLGKKCGNGYVKVKGKKDKKKRFVKDRVFTKVAVRKSTSKIQHMTRANGLIHFMKRGSKIVRRIQRVNPKLRKLISEKAYTELIQHPKVTAFLRTEIEKLRKSKSARVRGALKNKKQRKVVIRRLIKRRFNKKFAKICKALLKSQNIRDIRKKQFKDIITIRRYQPRIEKTIVRLPEIFKKQSNKKLKRFLRAKFAVSAPTKRK